MNIKPHTIYILVGPSNCGKSSFASAVVDECQKRDISCAVVSSDNCRRELLCDHSVDKMDERMMPVSSQAFDLLAKRVDLHSQYPVNTPVIIVDSTGLDRRFQDEMIEIAKRNNYDVELVLFDYASRSEYFAEDMSQLQREVTKRHVDKFRKYILPNLPNISKQRIKGLGKYKVTLSNDFVVLKRCKFPKGKYLVIGDIHGCYDELLECLQKNGVTIDDGRITSSPYEQIITVGDYLDKGPKIEETVNFLFANQAYISHCVGNHENYIHGRMTGKIGSDEHDDKFSSIVLVNDPEATTTALKFNALFVGSYQFIDLGKYIITHAPCYANELGKLRFTKKMRNFRYTHLTPEEVLVELDQMDQSSPGCAPKHIFGHIQFERVFKGKTKLGIDTGCVSGGELCAVILET
jgi:predicted kinase